MPIALAHTDVVEEYHASIPRDRIDQCRVPVIHRPAEAVQKYDRNAVRAFVSHAAIGNPMPVGHCEPRFSGLGLAVAAHPETREATGRGYKIEVPLSERLGKLQATAKRHDGLESTRCEAHGRTLSRRGPTSRA